MKLKFTTLLAVLLLAALAMPQIVEAQAGYNVSRVRGLDHVIATGNNQAVPAVVLTSRTATDEPQITRDAAANFTMTVSFGGLPIVQATAWTIAADGTGAEQIDAQTADFADGADIQFKMGATSLQIFVGTQAAGNGVADDTVIKLADLRLDLTSLDAGDKVGITVSGTDQADLVGLGTGGGRGSVSSTLTTAADGLSVSATKGNGLTCGSITGTSVTVTEGFARAWNPSLIIPEVTAGVLDVTQSGGNDHATEEDDVSGSVQVRLDVLNFPSNAGAKITWPGTVNDARTDVDPDTPNDQGGNIATLTLDKTNSDANGRYAIYTYEDLDAEATGDGDDGTAGTADDTNVGLQRYLNDAARTFKIDGITFANFGGASIDVTARLWPQAKRNTSDGKKSAADLKSALSFEHAAEDPTFAKDAREGAWVIVEDCVTYLLYPFITCGATAGWSTGVSVSNTSADGNVFGAFDETQEQHGAVVLYGFPRGQAAPAEGEMVEAVVSTVSTNLRAGDTTTFDCSSTNMAGMEGYAIIKANFQHARGMAFVLGNFADGAGVDVSHGYMAEVIDDPAERSEKITE